MLHDSSVHLRNTLSYIHTYELSVNISSAIARDINLVATLRSVNSYLGNSQKQLSRLGLVSTRWFGDIIRVYERITNGLHGEQDLRRALETI